LYVYPTISKDYLYQFQMPPAVPSDLLIVTPQAPSQPVPVEDNEIKLVNPPIATINATEYIPLPLPGNSAAPELNNPQHPPVPLAAAVGELNNSYQLQLPVYHVAPTAMLNSTLVQPRMPLAITLAVNITQPEELLQRS
jgi:hypothetical protein